MWKNSSCVPLLAGEELDVVEEQGIEGAILGAELVGALLAGGEDELREELLRRHVEDAAFLPARSRWAMACMRCVLPRPLSP